MFWGVIWILVGSFILLYPTLFQSSDISVYKEGIMYDPSAKIVDVSYKRVGLKGSYKFETKVRFSDGFEYISFDTERENHGIYYTISISNELKNDIIERAEYAHSLACRNNTIQLPKDDPIPIKPKEYWTCSFCNHRNSDTSSCAFCGREKN